MALAESDLHRNNSNLTQKEPLYCICRSFAFDFMIMCDFCKEWYHGECIKVTKKESKRIDIFCCKQCKTKNPALRTTYKKIYKRRKINRRKRKLAKNLQDSNLTYQDAAVFNTMKTPTFSTTKDAAINKCLEYGILEVLPQGIQQWNYIPSTVDELNCKKLADIHLKICDILKQREEIDKKILQLIELIEKSKKLENHFVVLQNNDDTKLMDCALRGAELSNTFERLLEQFNMNLEKTVTADDKTESSDEKWNIFCNRKIAKNLWCKKMKILCPLHSKCFRKVDEVCGFHLGEANGIIRFCENKGQTCHPNWEEIHRAELDLEKLTLFLKFKALKNEGEKLLREMSGCDDLESLMLDYIMEY